MSDEQPAETVRFERASVRYGNGPEVLHEVDLHLAAGSFHFLVGRSGAGKTSLLRLLYVAVKPSRGRVVLFGVDVAHAPRTAVAAVRRQIGVVFQDFRLLPQLTVYDNVALPLRIAGYDEDRVGADVLPLLGRLGLQPSAQALPPSLSGGQQQLVAIARAVIVRPRLLIADEPTASVDEMLALRLVRLFCELNRLGTTVLIATHNERLADAVRQPCLRLEAGRLLAAGDRPVVRARPAAVRSRSAAGIG